MSPTLQSARIDPAFRRAEENYASLRREYDAGSLNADQFKAAVEALRVDFAGRYWMLGVNSGRWYAYDGAAWREADPPIIAQTPKAASADAAPQVQGAGSAPAKKSGIPDWVYALVASIIALICWLHIARVF